LKNGISFNKEIESGFKSAIYLKMETMIDNIKRYRDDFKGNRIPKFEEKFVKERIFIANKNRARNLKVCPNPNQHDRKPHHHRNPSNGHKPKIHFTKKKRNTVSQPDKVGSGDPNKGIESVIRSTSRRRV